jgi:hypothetical protein
MGGRFAYLYASRWRTRQPRRSRPTVTKRTRCTAEHPLLCQLKRAKVPVQAQGGDATVDIAVDVAVNWAGGC